MKIRKIKIGIKSVEDAFKDAKEVMKKLEREEKVRKETGLYFTSIEGFRKALTPKRLELLHTIKTRKPSSINELARIAKRNLKNVADDVKYLAEIGLIEKKATKREIAPVINYDKIAFEIAV